VIAPSSFRSNVSEQSYFRAHQDRPDAGLFVGQPFRNPMRNGELSIALSRRLNNPDGTFNGVAANILPLTLFSDIFGDLDLTHSESTTLVRSDGKVIVRFPFREGDTARDLAKTPLFENYSAVEAGNLVSIGSPGDVDRLYTFRHLPNLPVILSVGVAVREIETEWLQKALVQGAVLLLLCAAAIVLCLRLRRENRGRMDAEAKLRGAAVQMAMTPVTDGLTGLANRKSFEERMTREWSRSIRAGTPIALVLLDPDLFKRYNDDYGHNEGDQVLRAIAGCIAASAMRPSDTNARVGGEEFAVLLPETDLTGASVVAERIRAAVAALAIPFEANPAGHLTISAGVTIARPAVGDPRASLIVRAAAALDAAKDAGRNIVGRADADGVISVGEQPLFRQVANEQQAL
jgi:diguanylate cyclase (GGDEF)-like protein